MLHVGQLIKQAREAVGVTQQQLAKKLKVTQGAIHQYERSASLQTATVEKIAKMLKIPLCELLECKPDGGSDDKKR